MYNLDRFQLDKYTFFSVFVLVYLFVLVAISGTSQYSPDSWSYFELAKTFYSDHFYKFNTYRSYFSYDRSASFPFGFPALLAVVNGIFGWNPVNAVYLNMMLAFSDFLLVISISLQINLPRITGLALATSLLFYPGFLDEVASGRSYPAAVLLVLTGLYIALGSRKNWYLLVGGALIGTSVLVRFDFLFTAWVSMMLLIWFQRRCFVAMLLINIGFLFGIIPWVIYSLIFFSKIWISDNSWVAISANQASVLDFPAQAYETLFINPLKWIKKIIFNGYSLFVSLTHSIQQQTLLLLLLAHIFLFFKKSNFLKKLDIFIAIIGIFIMLLPYLITGYNDSRYFTFLFFISTILVLILFCQDNLPNNFIFAAAIFITIFMGIANLVVITSSAYWAIIKPATQEHNKAIKAFTVCHKNEPDYTYVFVDKASRIAFRYGALTGNKVAIIPSNFEHLNQGSRSAFFQTIAPYRLFRSLKVDNCDTSDSLSWHEGGSE